MKRPLGRLNCVQVSSSFPCWSKIRTRLLPRSPTNSRPAESIASACGWSISPGPEPFLPNEVMNLPSRVNLSTRELAPPWPSDTKTSPLGATSTSLGW